MQPRAEQKNKLCWGTNSNSHQQEIKQYRSYWLSHAGLLLISSVNKLLCTFCLLLDAEGNIIYKKKPIRFPCYEIGCAKIPSCHVTVLCSLRFLISKYEDNQIIQIYNA